MNCLNGLARFPQLINRLVDNGIINSLKIVNELYSSDKNVIASNMETLSKISSNSKLNIDSSKGKDLIIKGGLVENLMSNIINLSKSNLVGPVLSGLTILEHLFLSDEGKALQSATIYKDFISILNNLNGNKLIEIAIAKIAKRTIKKEDITQILSFLKSYKDFSDCKNL